jgi:acyl-CoA thioesterase-1
MRRESKTEGTPIATGAGRTGGRVVLGTVLALAACSGSEPASQREAPIESSAAPSAAAPVSEAAALGPRVVVLGTSLTAGLGLDPDSAWPALAQRLADSAGVRVRIEPAGLSGETSAGALRRAEWVLREPADVVVLEVGANDGLRGVDPDTTRETLVALVERVRTVQPSAQVVLVQMEAPPNLGAAYTAAFHDAYVQAASRTGVPLLPFLLEGVAGEATLNQADGIHPNEAGSRLVAATMWRALAPLVATAR